MDSIDGFVTPLPTAKRAAYLDPARQAAVLVKEFGALRVLACWGDDVPDGRLTSFPLAVKREAEQTAVFSWVSWPSRAEPNRWPTPACRPVQCRCRLTASAWSTAGSRPFSTPARRGAIGQQCEAAAARRSAAACQLALYQSPGICGGFNLTLRAERLRMLMLSASTPSENAIAK